MVSMNIGMASCLRWMPRKGTLTRDYTFRIVGVQLRTTGAARAGVFSATMGTTPSAVSLTPPMSS
jgi:hypothetical protein